jgi:hypothetical protein
MNDDPWKVRVREARLLERPVRLRLPLRYGAVTLREAPQAFVHLRLQTPPASHTPRTRRSTR